MVSTAVRRLFTSRPTAYVQRIAFSLKLVTFRNSTNTDSN